jgi:hypothetical protein
MISSSVDEFLSELQTFEIPEGIMKCCIEPYVPCPLHYPTLKVEGSTPGCFYLRKRIPTPPYLDRHQKILVFMSYITSSTMP